MNARIDAALTRLRRWADSGLGLWVRRLLAGWFWLGAALLLTQKGNFWELSFAQRIPLPALLAVLLAVSILAALLDRLFPQRHISLWMLLSGAVLLLLSLAARYGGAEPLLFAAALILCFALLWRYACAQPFLADRKPLSRRGAALSVALLGLLTAAVIGLHAVLRYRCFYVPNYDGGLFTQMFHYMRTTGLPMTTCERDGLTSHFAVHFSPIFYLLLPSYMLSGGDPLVLGCGQAVILASGLIPLFLLCRNKHLSEKLTVLLSLAYCAYPALLGGTFYDLHENCFLTPLLLWLFWCGETDRIPGLIVSAVLTLCVKEDAAVFVAVYALYVLIGQKKHRRGLLLLGSALIWFFAAVFAINTFGDGVLMDRYASLMYESRGFGAMIKTLLCNPGYALRLLLFDEDSGALKLPYLLQMTVGVGLLPFISKKPARLLLAAPILLNLLTTYSYLHQIGFQYNFGVTAFFFYAAVLNLRDLPRDSRRFAAGFAAFASVVLCLCSTLPPVSANWRQYQAQRDKVTHMEAVLSDIPKDSSVTASTFLIAHLADRDVIYEDYYHRKPATEYVVLDIRSGLSAEQKEVRDHCLSSGYTVLAEHKDELLILHTDTPTE